MWGGNALGGGGPAATPWPPPQGTGPAAGPGVPLRRVHLLPGEGASEQPRGSACVRLSVSSPTGPPLPPSPRLLCRSSSSGGAGGGYRRHPRRAGRRQHFRKRNWSRENKGAAPGSPRRAPAAAGEGGWVRLGPQYPGPSRPRPTRALAVNILERKEEAKTTRQSSDKDVATCVARGGN